MSKVDSNKRYYENNKEDLLKKKRAKYATRDKKEKKIDKEASHQQLIKRLYNMTPEQYKQMAIEQDNKCAICKKPENVKDHRTGKVRYLAVDHDHKTNKIRQLLCRRCNAGMGIFEDDTELLQTVVQYLQKHSDKIFILQNSRALRPVE
jgi:hypothetical protein